MGILGALRLVQGAGALATSVSPGPTALDPISPWSGPLPGSVVIGDMFGTDYLPVRREEAVAIPALLRARNLICLLGRQPLRAYKDADLLASQPSFLYRTNGATPPQMRMIDTLDDLLFYGWSLWGVERGQAGQVLDAVRVPAVRWGFDSLGRVVIDDKPVDADQVVLFQGPFEGILTAGARTIRAMTKLEEAWISRVAVPIPVMKVQQTDDVELESDEIDDLLNGYAEARKKSTGSVVFVPKGLDLTALGDSGLDLLVAGRNAAVLDAARMTGLPASLLDASATAASLTYSNTEARRNEYADLSLDLWATAVEARLSMDDVTPRGTRIAFDRTNLAVVPDTGLAPSTED